MSYPKSTNNFLAGRAVIKIIVLLLAGIIILPIIFLLLSGKADVAYAKEYIVAIQNHTAQAMIAKSIGDDIVAGRSKQSMTVVRKKITAVQTDLAKLKVPAELNEYKAAVATWVDEIAQASSNKSSPSQKAAWGKISPSPQEVSVKLNQSQAKQSLQASIQQVALSKQFGNYAVATKNTEAMRSVGAHLFAQSYWFKVLHTAYPGDICADNGCLSVVWGQVPILQSTAFSVMKWTPDARDQWDTAWEKIAQDIKPAGISITGTGISEGQTAKPAVPPVAQTFFDTCKTSGGLVDDVGGVKTGLPTTEGGWTCWEPKKQCWHYLTYSGWLFVNGGPNPQACPKIDTAEFALEGQTLGGAGSLAELPPSPPPADQPTTASWNGVYQISYGPYSCSIERTTPALSSDTVTVSNNKIISNSNTALTSSTPIDAAGRSTITYPVSGADYSGNSTDSYTFSPGTNGQTTANVSWVVQAGGTIEDSYKTWSCSGTGSGSRIR